jgi:hypothetical protein
MGKLTRLGCLTLLFATVHCAFAQNNPKNPAEISNPHASENAEQVAKILGISQVVSDARRMHSENTCGTPATLEELSMRQDILERVVAASFDVDGVLAELESERARLSELSTALQSRRDHTVNLLNVANLVTGTGIGIGVNALQFSSSTANIGNSLGVGSGIGSTVLSIIGIKRQRGPLAVPGKVPNMLAPLFGRAPKLNSYYPQPVIAYLHAAPVADASSGSRLDQLMAEWKQAGRVGEPTSPKTEKKITALTASSEDKAKLSIDDLSDRIAMLEDVSGRVGLMKRDLADLMMSLHSEKNCTK